MMGLKDRLGEEKVNTALRRFLTEFKYQSAPYPTTLDLMAYLTQEATEQEKSFVSNLFEHISLYDLKTSDVKVVAVEGKDDFYDVTLTIDAALKRADGQGKETDVEFVDLIDIGLFNADPEDLSAKDFVLYLAKHEIKTGSNEVTIRVKGKPSFAGVDPFVKYIDRDSADNIYRL
jgi:ABC-2 type transport system permease protein